MSGEEQIGTVQGGSTRKTFKVYYNPHTKHVFLGSGWGGAKNRIPNLLADDAQHAIRIAEAHVTNK